jgi:hypothetical protein
MLKLCYFRMWYSLAILRNLYLASRTVAVGHTRTHKCCMKMFYTCTLKITNMATVRKLGVLSGICQVMDFYISGSYAQECTG